MSEPPSTGVASTLADAQPRASRLRRLHALTGVVPVGVFLVGHLWTNARALSGQASFDTAVSQITRLPYLPLIETFGIFVPLAFHALYGVKLALGGERNVLRYPDGRNWMWLAQRATGLVTLAFLAWHLLELRVPKALGTLGADAFYPTLCARLSSTTHGLPLVALAYLVGIGASVLHLANGLWALSTSYVSTASPRAQRVVAGAVAVFGLALFLAGANTALYFATGVRLLAIDGGAGSSTCEAPAPPRHP